MQLLLVRHALPLRSEHGQGSDPELAELGVEQAKRLPAALERFPISRLVSTGDHAATVVVFAHGGVINAVVHHAMRTTKLLCVGVDYAGVTRVLSRREGGLSVAAINGTEQDGICCREISDGRQA